MRLVYAFNHDEDDGNDLDAEETLTALAVDWANDSHGDGDVDYEDFLDSVFELARTWAEDEGVRVRVWHSASLLSHCLTSVCAMYSLLHAHTRTDAQTETVTSMRTIWFYTCRTFSTPS